MRDLGLLHRVVACTKYCADVCPEVEEGTRQIISDSWTAQADEIIAAQPDFVIAAVPYQLEAVGQILKTGIRFLGLAPRTLADVCADILTIASVMGVYERGQEVISKMQADIEEIRHQCANESKQLRVFCEEWGKPIIASQPWVAELVALAQGHFLGEPAKQVSSEDILQAEPDILIAAWCGAGDRVPLEKIVEQRGWNDTPAVSTGRVFCISDELLNTPATSLVQGFRAIAWALHPTRFPKPVGIRQIRDGRS
jgi:iron complex transport system substrate-binding protein